MKVIEAWWALACARFPALSHFASLTHVEMAAAAVAGILAAWWAIESIRGKLAERRVRLSRARRKYVPKCPKCGGRTVIALHSSGPRRGMKYRACVSRQCKGSRANERAARIRTRNAKVKSAR